MQIKSYDAYNNMTEYTYDKNNRLISTIDPELNVKSRTYDDAGNISTETDGRGNTTAFGYDEFNRLISVTNGKQETTSYTYDLNGNMLTQTDGKGNTIIYEYNARNLPVKRIDHGGRTGSPGSYSYDPAKMESYTYLADGSLAAKTDRNGNTTTYSYDIHGRLLSQAVDDITISYTYDNNGNPLTMTDSTGITTRTYDQLNRVITKTVPGIGTTAYLYDIIEGVEEGHTAEKTTDPKGNQTDKVYDRAGRLKYVTADGNTTTYNYYDNGSLQSVIYPDGSVEEYTYYSDKTLHTLVNKKADQSIVEAYTYTYDEANNQVSKVDAKGTTTYTYDELNRLESVTEAGGRITAYTYDATGNRLTETVTMNGDTVVTTYSYDNQNRLTATERKLNGQTVETAAYAYDNNGNQLSVQKTPYIEGTAQTPLQTTNVYDKLNRLTETCTPEDIIVTSTYNGEGKRVQKQTDDVITKYLYEADRVIIETDGQGRQSSRNVYGINLISRTFDTQTAAQTVYYYKYNGHADITLITDDTGETAASYYYDAFGNIEEETVTGSVYGNPYKYAGYRHDEETGYYYLMARYYDPVTARFLSEDTYRGSISDPLSLNLYTYCANNPVKYYDPTGHAFTEWDSKNVKSAKDRQVIMDATKKWIEANAKGDKKAMDEAHKQAEAVRNKYRTADEKGRDDGFTVMKDTNEISTRDSSKKKSSSRSSSSKGSSAKETPAIAILYDLDKGSFYSVNVSGGSSNSYRDYLSASTVRSIVQGQAYETSKPGMGETTEDNFKGGTFNLGYSAYIVGGKLSLQAVGNEKSEYLAAQIGGGSNVGAVGFDVSTGVVSYDTNDPKKLRGITGDFGSNVNTPYGSIGTSMIVGDGIRGYETSVGLPTKTYGYQTHAMPMKTFAVMPLPKPSPERIQELMERH